MKKPLPLKRPIYLDNAASTPMDERVIKAMCDCLSLEGSFANSSSKDHVYGWQAAEVVEKARDEVATCVSCSPLELTFTSGATESNNLAIRGLALSMRKSNSIKNHIITTTVEHKSVLECCNMLEQEGFSVTYLKPLADGSVNAQMVEQAINEHTFLISIAHANSVLGTINDIHAIASMAKNYGVYLHSDCAQSNGFLNLDLDKSDLAMATLTPEKIYGPKGIGALYIKRELNLNLTPLIVGGGHEKGLRGGTLATHQIAAMGKAFDILNKEREQVVNYISALRERLVNGLEQIDGCIINGSKTHHLAGIVSASFTDIDGAHLLPSLRKIACSSGSACSSKELKASYVLTEIGLSDKLARASLRLSIGRFNTEQEIDEAINSIKETILMLKAMPKN